MTRESASWTRSHWAGTLKQLEAAAQTAQREVQALVPFPADFDPDGPEYDREKHREYLAAESAHRLSVTVIEQGGYTSRLDSLDEMANRPPYTLDEITAIIIGVGQGTPSAEIRLGVNGLAVEVNGNDRNWVAGLRQQLDAALKPRHRLHAPLASEPTVLMLPGMVGFFAIFIGLDQALYYGAHWSTKTARVAVSAGVALLWLGACGALAWASAKNAEVLPEDGLPRYERWRKRTLGWAGTVILGVIGTALYSLVVS